MDHQLVCAKSISSPSSSSTHLVVEISHVLNKVDVVRKVVPQDPPDDILGQVVSSMTHMGRVIDGRSTVVPVHLTTPERNEWVLR